LKIEDDRAGKRVLGIPRGYAAGRIKEWKGNERKSILA